jgi:spore maturation protein CgeB
MLKVLYLPLGEQPGTYDGWRNIGVELEIYDYWTDWLQNKNIEGIKQRFLSKVATFQPDLIHMQLQFTGAISIETLREAKRMCPKAVMVNWSGDVRADPPHPFTSLASALDFTLISSSGQLELYKRAGCHNVKYWQIGYDPKTAFPMNKTEFTYDISFTGNNYGNMFPDGPLRASAAKALKDAFGNKFGLFGSGYPGATGSTSHQQSNQIYNDSLCVLSISNFNNIAHYFSDRLLLCLGSGRPTISWYFPNYEDYFVDGRDIFIARSNQDIIDIVNYCKANPEAANQVGVNGQLKVLKEHTFTSRVMELLQITNLAHLV